MRQSKQYSDSAKFAFISIMVNTIIIASQIPTIKTYLDMIDFSSITLLEAFVTIVVTVMLYAACEIAYRSLKQK